MTIDPGIIGVITEALMIIVIGWVTNKKPTYTGAVANGILVIIAGGNLLYYQKPLGFLLLVYGAFVMVAGMKEKDLEEADGKGDWMGWVVKIIGNYIVTAAIVILVAMISYGIWPFVG